MIDEASSFTPLAVHDGLACYAAGAGESVFLMPYPYGFGRAPIVQEPLAAGLSEIRVPALDRCGPPRSASVSGLQ
jgi:hypothetical protein